MADFTGDYSGRSQYYLLLRVTQQSQTATGTNARVQVGAVSKQGWGSWTTDSGAWSVTAGSTTIASGRVSLDFRPDSTGKVIWIYDNVHFLKHDDAGNFGMLMQANHSLPLFGTAAAGGITRFSPLGSAPDAPAKPTLKFTATKTYAMSWNAPDGNGNALTRYEVQLGTTSNFSGVGMSNVAVSTRTYTRSDLTAGKLYYFRVRAVNARGAGAWSPTLSFTVSNTPNTPTLGAPTGITPTSFRVPYTVGGSNGQTITQTQIQWSTSPTFATVAWTDVKTGSGSGFSDPSGIVPLVPGTKYYVRARSSNSVGWGSWSAAVSQTTLASGPPVISVTPDVSGRTATVNLSPPGGTSGVSSYKIEFRVKGSTAATAATTTSTSYVRSGLTPGQTYEWRAAAVFSASYTSPWTGWTSRRQPAPNTSPGSYFDGNTPASPDETFSWTGAAGKSTSTARGVSTLGWSALVDGIASVYLQQVSGGRYGGKAARYTSTRKRTTAIDLGPSVSNVDGYVLIQPGTPYSGVISVMTSDARPVVQPVLVWATATGAVISRVVGPSVATTPGEWTDISVGPATSPANAARATIIARVAATTAAPFYGGEWVSVDAAAVFLAGPYDYFDGSFRSGDGFLYGWDGAAHRSLSSRTVVPEVMANPLRDPDCADLPKPPRPPAISSDCIDEVGMWRRYTVGIPASEVRMWLEGIPTVILKTGVNPERQVRIRFYEDADGDPATFLDGEPSGEMIVTYIPPRTEVTLDGISELAWASVNGGDPQPANHLIYGTGGTPAVWPVLSCGNGYVLTLDTPLESPAGNLKTRVMMTQRA